MKERVAYLKKLRKAQGGYMKRVMSTKNGTFTHHITLTNHRMISTSTNAPEHPEQAAAPPALPGETSGGGFQPGMSGEEMLG